MQLFDDSACLNLSHRAAPHELRHVPTSRPGFRPRHGGLCCCGNTQPTCCCRSKLRFDNIAQPAEVIDSWSRQWNSGLASKPKWHHKATQKLLCWSSEGHGRGSLSTSRSCMPSDRALVSSENTEAAVSADMVSNDGKPCQCLRRPRALPDAPWL